MLINEYLTQHPDLLLGKKLTKPELNLIKTLGEKYGICVLEPAPPTRNPMTGYTWPLPPFISALVNVVQVAYRNYVFDHGNMKINDVPMPIAFYDRVKYLILKLDSKVYSNFIDRTMRTPYIFSDSADNYKTIALVTGEEDFCPVCRVSWVGEEIPEKKREFYGTRTHFKKNIVGHEIMGVYDGVLYWVCTHCNSKLPRFERSRPYCK